MASKNKSRKLLETTLGKASSSTGKDETLDLSHLRKPIETSIFGLTQVLTLFETATDEVMPSSLPNSSGYIKNKLKITMYLH